jgi:benzoyl-CoA-dihydrodiol lyase
VAKPQAFAEMVKARALELAKLSDRPDDAKGVALTPLKRVIDDKGYHYNHVEAAIDRGTRTATITVKAPQGEQPATLDALLAQGDQWWPLAMARDLDDAILLLRTHDAEVGTWVLKTEGSVEAVLAADKVLGSNQGHWFVRETIGFMRRTFSRIDVASRSLIALVDTGSCFAGTLAELAFAADRSYMLDLPDSPDAAPALQLSPANFGWFPAVNKLTRLQTRFYEDDATIAQRLNLGDSALRADQALALGLVTLTPDDIDWEDEIRIMLEERASMSPDAMTGLEASLRFPGKETMETRIFGRLSAWQNWIFIRPNAVGEEGALKLFGTGKKAKFDWKRV